MNSHEFDRLCNDPHLAEEVVRLKGLRRLVELCKCESARVSSDGVLVACLAAVRKVISAEQSKINIKVQFMNI